LRVQAGIQLFKIQKQSRGVRPRTPTTFFTRVKKVAKESTPRFAAHFVGALRCSTGQAAAELALCAQTVLAEIP